MSSFLPSNFNIFLEALTIPSDPKPYILISLKFLDNLNSHSGKLLKVTSSYIPRENLSIGLCFSILSNTLLISDGVVFLEERPYIPLYTSIFSSFNTSHTSKYKGVPVPENSLVLSSTVILDTLLGNTFKKYSLENGLYK